MTRDLARKTPTDLDDMTIHMNRGQDDVTQ